jgi:hypothetical protein
MYQIFHKNPIPRVFKTFAVSFFLESSIAHNRERSEIEIKVSK